MSIPNRLQAKTSLNVAVLLGGRSAEHEISLISAYNILKALNAPKPEEANAVQYQVTAIGITRQGTWLLIKDWEDVLSAKEGVPQALSEASGIPLALLPGTAKPFRIWQSSKALDIDIVFPVLHGPYGEDGSVQGLLRQVGLPFVGGGVLASAVGMDKDVMKRLLESHLPLAKFMTVRSIDKEIINFEKTAGALGLPFYIKPANQGSSVGIHRVTQKNEFANALADAFSYDPKIVIEENILGRELECAVLGTAKPEASLVGEIAVKGGFYSYQAKYIDKTAAVLHIPADLPSAIAQSVQESALKAFQILGLEGLARVDMFLEEQGRIIINEVNTMPGFTGISMYPGLWEKSGLKLRALLDRLIALSQERFFAEEQLKIRSENEFV